MTWLKSNWRWGALNMFAVATLAFVVTQGSTDWNATHTFDPGLESGVWGIRFLLISLAMSPLSTYFGWRSSIKLRKPAGLWSFGFAALHFLYFIRESQTPLRGFLSQPYMLLGLVGLIVLSALAITSNRWAMRGLRKNWKRLHRLVYVAAPTIVYHAILATGASKKLLFRDPNAEQELKLYFGVLVVLLVMRIPAVRRVIKRCSLWSRPQREPDLTAIPIQSVDRSSKIEVREAGIPLADLLDESFPLEDAESFTAKRNTGSGVPSKLRSKVTTASKRAANHKK